MKTLAAVLSVVLSLTSACAFDEEAWEDEEEIGEVDLEGRVVNGRVINGRVINGRLINGTSFNGYILSVSLDHVQLGLNWVNGVSLVKSKFSSGKTSGAAFVGAVFDGTLSDGKVIPLKITSVRQAATDLWAYNVQYQSDLLVWKSVCEDATGAAVEAYPLNGVWNHNEGVVGGGSRSTPAGKFTFACRSGALGKCVDFGYVPWRSASGKSLLGYHDTCARAVRADWCGDGRSGTQDGNLINLYDRLKVQKDTETWPGEAEWNAAGATCLNKFRVADGELRGEIFPDCAKIKMTGTCAGSLSGMRTDSLEVTEYLLP